MKPRVGDGRSIILPVQQPRPVAPARDQLIVELLETNARIANAAGASAHDRAILVCRRSNLVRELRAVGIDVQVVVLGGIPYVGIGGRDGGARG